MTLLHAFYDPFGFAAMVVADSETDPDQQLTLVPEPGHTAASLALLALAGAGLVRWHRASNRTNRPV